MTSRLPLDGRQARIARALLLALRPVTAETLAADLHLTDRMVRYNLAAVEAYLAGHGLRVQKRPGVGIWTEGSAHSRAAAAADLDAEHGPAVLDAADRQARILLAILRAAPRPLSSQVFEARLGVSGPTVRRDLRGVEAWLEQHRLHLSRLPGVGIAVVGGELEVRGALLAAVLEAATPRLLLDLEGSRPSDGSSPTNGSASDVEGLLAELDLPAMRSILGEVYPALAADDVDAASAAVFLGLIVLRVREGNLARMTSGRLQSLLDHRASVDALRIADRLHAETGVALGRSDVAAITEGLLGLQIAGSEPAPSSLEAATVDRLLDAAAERLHPDLAHDGQLRASLTEHLRRLDVRLRFGLPVSNPLQQEVRRRYPEVYRVAAEILAEVVPEDAGPLPLDEVGLLTMYLAGSLERLRLRPRVRVMVVCPAGMATVWILVSRLRAEFPQLEVSRVVSRSALTEDLDPAVDLIVSTVPIDVAGETPTVVVSPLLRDVDIRRLSRAIAGLG